MSIRVRPRPPRSRATPGAGRAGIRAGVVRRLVDAAGATALLAALTCPVTPASAQEVSLEVVDSLARWGNAVEARTLLDRWVEASGGESSTRDRQRVLWLRAILTVDPEQAAFDLQRLVVEFPGGPWTDEARLRLAQYATAVGDVRAAATHYQALVRDHPGSPHRLAAREWLEANAGAVRAAELAAATAPPRAAPEPPRDTLGRERVARVAPSRAEGDPEASGRAEVPVSEAEAERPPPEEPEPRGPQAEPGEGDFTVQLGAFSTGTRARVLMDRVRDAGFEPRLVTVPGSELLRVRVGRFVAPSDAVQLRDRLRARGFEAIVRNDAPRESAGVEGGAPRGEA